MALWSPLFGSWTRVFPASGRIRLVPRLPQSGLGGSMQPNMHGSVPPLTVYCMRRRARTRASTGSAVLYGTYVYLLYFQSSAGDLRVQLYCCTVRDFPCRLFVGMISSKCHGLQSGPDKTVVRVRAGSESGRKRNLEYASSLTQWFYFHVPVQY